MKNAVVSCSLLFGVLSMNAQGSQQGSVAIAEAIVPASEDKVAGFGECVEKLVLQVKVTSKEALKYCIQATKVASNTATRIANEAADATKASRPIVVMNSYGNYGNYGGGYQQPVVITTEPVVVESQPQQIRQSRPPRQLRYHTPRYSRQEPADERK